MNVYSLPYIVQRLGGELRRTAQQAAVTPWAEEYLALPQPLAGGPSPESADAIDRALLECAVLWERPATAEEAVETLRTAFEPDPGLSAQLGRIVEVPTALVLEKLQAFGAVPRYEWLLARMSTIRADIVVREGTALKEGFVAAFEMWHHAKEAPIDQLTGLVNDLERMVRTDVAGAPLPEPLAEEPEKMAKPTGMVPRVFDAGTRRF